MLTKNEILDLIKDARILGKPKKSISAVSTDSRTIRPGELFIPLKGKKHNGRKFIKQALKKGALVLDCRNGLKALQTLAAYHRSKFNIPVIGVTGSVGKTTTKDMIAAILAQEMPVLKNEENHNNEIGLPLTLLRLKKKHKAAVVEMGMQALGEIELLAKIARPTVSVVTNIGEAHLKFLKNKRNIARAKAEVFKHQRKTDHAVINADDEYFEHLMSRVKCPKSNVVDFGILEKAAVTPKDLAGIKLPVPGQHNIYNALAAIGVAKILKLKRSSIRKGLSSFRPSSKRMDVINLKGRTKIINDTYNASPQSMAAALRVLAALEGRKIAVLGDMFELGKSARKAHARIGRLARKLGIDMIISIGDLSKSMRADLHFKNKKPAARRLKKIMRLGDKVLVKASRGMRLEEVVEAIRRI